MFQSWKLWDERCRSWKSPLRPSDTEFVTRGPQKNPSLSLLAKEGMKAIVAMNFPEVVKVPTHQKGHLFPPKRTLKKTDFILNHPTFFFMRLMRLRLRVIPKMKES